MFVCKTKILNDYYNVVFPWLEKCGKKFGFNKLKDMDYKDLWFFSRKVFILLVQQKLQSRELPIIVKDLQDYKNL